MIFHEQLQGNSEDSFENYQPPKKSQNVEEKTAKELEEQMKLQEEAAVKTQNTLQRNFSLPSLSTSANQYGKTQGAVKKRNPATLKQEMDAMIFNEVFIQPRAERLNELI